MNVITPAGKYHLYQPFSEDINLNCSEETHEYKHVFSLELDTPNNLKACLYWCNTERNQEYEDSGARDIDTGDIIITPENKAYIVDRVLNFKPVSLSYISFSFETSENDEVISQQMLSFPEHYGMTMDSSVEEKIISK